MTHSVVGLEIGPSTIAAVFRKRLLERFSPTVEQPGAKCVGSSGPWTARAGPRIPRTSIGAVV